MEQVWVFKHTYPQLYHLLLPYRGGFDVQGYAPSTRSRLMLGLPVFDPAATPVSRKTLLVVANFTYCDPALVTQMKERVTEAGGRVILTTDQHGEGVGA